MANERRRGLRGRGIVLVVMLVLAFLALDLWRSSRQEPAGGGAVVRVSRPLMGTIVTVAVYAPAREEEGARAAAFAALDEATRLEGRISSWQEGSETSAVNRAAGGPPVAVGEDLRELIATSLEWSRRTNGAFDVTGGPLFELWEQSRDSGTLPDEAAIGERLQVIGYEHLRVAGDAVGLEQAGMRLGFGAIGKGFIADRVAAWLRTHGHTDFFIDAGGDLVVGGSHGSRPWNVAVRHPRQAGLLATCHVTDCAVATSGDYERFIEVHGERYSHLIDPRTGWPVKGLGSVTVIARRGVDADALATALFVLGVTDGLALVEGLAATEAVLIEPDGRVHLSSGLRLEGDELILER